LVSLLKQKKARRDELVCALVHTEAAVGAHAVPKALITLTHLVEKGMLALYTLEMSTEATPSPEPCER